MTISFKLAAAVAALSLSSPALATSFDLATDFGTSSAWSYRQGAALLPFQANFAPVIESVPQAFSPSDVPSQVGQLGAYLPFIGVATKDSGTGFQAGDVVVHSADEINGTTALGDATIRWTSPVDDTVDVKGFAYYAQFFPLQDGRSNEYDLLLDDVLLLSGTISPLNSDRDHPLVFGIDALLVHQGGRLELVIKRSPGVIPGSIDGVGLSISSSVARGIPEISPLLMLALALLSNWTASRTRDTRMDASRHHRSGPVGRSCS